MTAQEGPPGPVGTVVAVGNPANGLRAVRYHDGWHWVHNGRDDGRVDLEDFRAGWVVVGTPCAATGPVAAQGEHRQEFLHARQGRERRHGAAVPADAGQDGTLRRPWRRCGGGLVRATDLVRRITEEAWGDEVIYAMDDSGTTYTITEVTRDPDDSDDGPSPTTWIKLEEM